MCLPTVQWRALSIGIKSDSPFGIMQLFQFFEKLKVHINLENLFAVKNFLIFVRLEFLFDQ